METQFGSGIAVDAHGRSAGRTAAADAAAALDADRADFCQVSASATYDYGAVLDGVDEVLDDETTVVGCSSSGEFTDERTASGSVAVALVASDSMAFFADYGTGLREDVTGCVREATRSLPSEVDGYPYRAAIVLHDGLVGVGEQVAMVTQRRLGQQVSLAGASAGDDMRMDRTEVFCDGTAVTDGVVVALIASAEPTAVTVDHGHSPISDPLTVTDAEGSVVRELEGRPAFEVWRDAIRDHAADEFGVDVDTLEPGTELTELLTRYEFGIDQGRAYKIRWPGLTTDTDGPLEFAVDVPEGTVLRVMESPDDAQVEAVRSAAREARAELGEAEVAGGFVYDCVCRSVILGDAFDTAVDAIRDELAAPFTGFETYGELCMERGQTSGYHNTTAVVLLLPR